MLLIDEVGAHLSISSFMMLMFSRIGFKFNVFISDFVSSRSFSMLLIIFSKLLILWVSFGMNPVGWTVRAEPHEFWLIMSDYNLADWGSTSSASFSDFFSDFFSTDVFHLLIGEGDATFLPPPGRTSLMNSWTFCIDFSKSEKSTFSAIISVRRLMSHSILSKNRSWLSTF